MHAKIKAALSKVSAHLQALPPDEFIRKVRQHSQGDVALAIRDNDSIAKRQAGPSSNE